MTVPLNRRRLLQTGGALAAGAAVWPALRAAESRAPKVLRYAFEVAETSFDPVKINDLYSRTVTPHIFESPYRYDHLARPIRVRPCTAAAMPEVSSDFRTWTVRLQPGIFFADDPAFKGQKRELVAADYVYTFKRFADPANLSPNWTDLADKKIAGLAALRQRALDTKAPFDYDREIEGLRALDRYTLQIKLDEPRPRFIDTLAGGDLYGAVAREVIEFYGREGDAHPVGTGPFRLAQWRRSSFIVLERNPQFRELRYDEQPAANDTEGQVILARLKGRRLPLVDRVEISIIEEEQPRWLSFVNGEADIAYQVGFQYATIAMPGGKVAPNLAKQGIRGFRIKEPSSNYLFFNMEDPLVGGYTPQQVALRRAIGLGMDIREEIEYAYSGIAEPTNSAYVPFTSGYHDDETTELSRFDPARARALLDLYGHLDRDGDGWREHASGAPLLLRLATQSDLRSRRIAEVFEKNMKALGIRTRFDVAQWPENLKAARAGRLQAWTLGGYAAGPDGADTIGHYHSAQIGGMNMARFKLPAMDRLYERLQVLPDGPEREALFREAEKIALAYLPYRWKLNRIAIDMVRPQVIGYRRPVFWTDWWQYVDIDPAAAVNG